MANLKVSKTETNLNNLNNLKAAFTGESQANRCYLCFANNMFPTMCHSQVQNAGKKTAEILQLVPGIKLNVVECCSGHASTFGVKKEFLATAMKIGKPVFKAMANNEPGYIFSDGQLAGHHIEQDMEEAGFRKSRLAHPLALLRKAYGI